MYAKLPLRPHVSPTQAIMPMLANGRCWHFDAWMLRDGDDRLYIRVETRAGGREQLTALDYIVENGRARMCAMIPADAQTITLQDKGEWPNADALNDVHRRYVLPWAARVPDGYHSRSVCLHYVRAPDLAPIPDDVVNLAH